MKPKNPRRPLEFNRTRPRRDWSSTDAELEPGAPSPVLLSPPPLGASPHPRIPHSYDSDLRTNQPIPLTAFLRRHRGLASAASPREIQRRSKSPYSSTPTIPAPRPNQPSPLTAVLRQPRGMASAASTREIQRRSTSTEQPPAIPRSTSRLPRSNPQNNLPPLRINGNRELQRAPFPLSALLYSFDPLDLTRPVVIAWSPATHREAWNVDG